MISTNDVRPGMVLNLPDGLFQIVGFGASWSGATTISAINRFPVRKYDISSSHKSNQ